MRDQEPTTWKGEIPLESLYTAGIAGEIFFRKLKQGVIVGTRCVGCKQVYAPARLFCERCFAELKDTVTVGPGGIVKAVTIAHQGPDGEKISPAVFAAIQLDGATTTLVHRLDVKKPAIGLRVKAVFRPKRTGSINDIERFA